MGLRLDFYLCGMVAEVDFLAREKFTGQALYWRDGQEMRRRLTRVDVGGPHGSMETGAVIRSESFYERFKEWVNHGEGKMRIFFTQGFVKRIEF